MLEGCNNSCGSHCLNFTYGKCTRTANNNISPSISLSATASIESSKNRIVYLNSHNKSSTAHSSHSQLGAYWRKGKCRSAVCKMTSIHMRTITYTGKINHSSFTIHSTTKTRNLPYTIRETNIGFSISNKSSRTGFPTTSALEKRLEMPAIQLAILPNNLFVKPTIAFCSCKMIGTPQSFAATPAGPET